MFGVPLELLVEREGSDSLLGATRSTLRIPTFIDDVVSAMKQMGRYYNTPYNAILTFDGVQICPLRASSARMATFDD